MQVGKQAVRKPHDPANLFSELCNMYWFATNPDWEQDGFRHTSPECRRVASKIVEIVLEETGIDLMAPEPWATQEIDFLYRKIVAEKGQEAADAALVAVEATAKSRGDQVTLLWLAALPAQRAGWMYGYRMTYGCTSLKRQPGLTSDASGATYHMFPDVAHSFLEGATPGLDIVTPVPSLAELESVKDEAGRVEVIVSKQGTTFLFDVRRPGVSPELDAANRRREETGGA